MHSWFLAYSIPFTKLSKQLWLMRCLPVVFLEYRCNIWINVGALSLHKNASNIFECQWLSLFVENYLHITFFHLLLCLTYATLFFNTDFFSFVGKRREGLVKGGRKYFKKSWLYYNQTVVIKIESYSQYTSLWVINVNI